MNWAPTVMVDFFGWTSFWIFVPDVRSPSPCKNCQIAKLSNCGHIFRNQNAILSKRNDKISELLNKAKRGHMKVNPELPSSILNKSHTSLAERRTQRKRLVHNFNFLCFFNSCVFTFLYLYFSHNRRANPNYVYLFIL